MPSLFLALALSLVWPALVAGATDAGLPGPAQHAAPQASGETPGAGTAAHCPNLVPRISFLASLHGVLRLGALGENVNRQASPGLGRGILIYQRLEDSFPVRRGPGTTGSDVPQSPQSPADRSVATWQLLDSLVLAAPDLDGLRRRAAGLPATLPGGLETGPTMSLLLEALEVASPAYLAEGWPEGEALAQSRLAWWSESLAPVLPPMLAAATASLGLAGVCPEVPVVLVPSLPGRGAATYRGPAGVLVAAAVDTLAGPDLAEAVLHEALHAVEASAGEGQGIPSRLRAELERRGADPFTVRQLPHALLFVLAAQTVRDHLDPDHEPLGRSRGAYDRGLRRYLGVLEPAVERVAAGHLPPEDLIPLLAGAFAPQPAP